MTHDEMKLRESARIIWAQIKDVQQNQFPKDKIPDEVLHEAVYKMIYMLREASGGSIHLMDYLPPKEEWNKESKTVNVPIVKKSKKVSE